MSALEGMVLGLVQGLTEFLPVSSSGHLVIGQTLFGLAGPQFAFDVFVHGATMVAIVVAFRRRIVEVVSRREIGFLAKIGVATLPAVAVALIAGEAVERAFAAPVLVVVALAATGLGLLSLYALPDQREWAAEPSWSAAILIGVAQAAAILPGVSRSGATIVTALWLGVAPAAAAEFSFLLGVPAIAGALVYQTGALRAVAAGGDAAIPLGLGAATAFASGLVAIAIVFRVLERHAFRRFGFYCLGAAAAFGLWLAWGGA